MPKGLGDVYVGPRRRTTSLHHHNQGSGISSTSCTRSTDLCTRHSLSYLSASATTGVPPGGVFSLISDVATPPNVVQPASVGSPISSPVCACVTPLPCVTHCRHANYPPSRHADPDGNGGVRVDRNHNRIHKSQGRQLGNAGTHHTHTQD